MASPVAVSVEKPQALSGTSRGVMPRRLQGTAEAPPMPVPSIAEHHDGGVVGSSARMDP